MLEDLECGGSNLRGTPGVGEGESGGVRWSRVGEHLELRNDAERGWSTAESLCSCVSEQVEANHSLKSERLTQKRSELVWLLAVTIEPSAVTTSISTT